MEPWPFSDPKNVAVYTVWRILNRVDPILRVCHDEDDGSWQFHTGQPVEMKDAALVALEVIADLDPSIVELADLPEGWCAVRTDPQSPRQRSRHETS